jgi:hypothetical protein
LEPALTFVMAIGKGIQCKLWGTAKQGRRDSGDINPTLAEAPQADREAVSHSGQEQKFSSQAHVVRFCPKANICWRSLIFLLVLKPKVNILFDLLVGADQQGALACIN